MLRHVRVTYAAASRSLTAAAAAQGYTTSPCRFHASSSAHSAVKKDDNAFKPQKEDTAEGTLWIDRRTTTTTTNRTSALDKPRTTPMQTAVLKSSESVQNLSSSQTSPTWDDSAPTVSSDAIGDGMLSEYNRRISRAQRSGNTRAALGVLAEMKTQGLQPNVITYSSLIAAAAQSGNGPLAFSIYDEMRLQGVSPNAITVTSLLEACARNSRKVMYDDALRIFRECSDTLGIRPDVPMVNALLKVLSSPGSTHLSAAFSVVEEGKSLQMDGFPNKTTYMMLASGCFTRDDRRRLTSMLPREPLVDEVAVWTVLMQSAVVGAISGAARKARHAFAVNEENLRLSQSSDFWEIEDDSVTFASSTTLVVSESTHAPSPSDTAKGDAGHVVGAAASCFSDDAAILWARASEERPHNMAQTTAGTVRMGRRVSVGAAEVQEVLAEMRARGITPSSATWITALQYNAVLAREVEAIISSSGTPLDRGLAVWLIRAYGRQNDLKAALSVFERAVSMPGTKRSRNDRGNDDTNRHIPRVYGAAIAACADAQDLRSAERVVQLARDSDVVLTEPQLNAYMKVAAKCGYGGHAVQVYDEMRAMRVRMTVLTFTTLFDACANNTKGVLVRDAMRAREDMAGEGVVPDAICLSAYVCVFVAADDVDGALSAFSDAECFAARGFPTAAAINAMRAVCKTIPHRRKLGETLAAFRSAGLSGT